MTPWTSTQTGLEQGPRRQVSRRALSLLEVVVMISLWGVLAGIAAPLSLGLIARGRAALADPGPSIDHLAWELRLAAARSWQVQGSDLLLNGERWSNQEQGIAVEGVLHSLGTALDWELQEAGLLIRLHIPGRDSLEIFASGGAQP